MLNIERHGSEKFQKWLYLKSLSSVWAILCISNDQLKYTNGYLREKPGSFCFCCCRNQNKDKYKNVSHLSARHWALERKQQKMCLALNGLTLALLSHLTSLVSSQSRRSSNNMYLESLLKSKVTIIGTVSIRSLLRRGV